MNGSGSHAPLNRAVTLCLVAALAGCGSEGRAEPGSRYPSISGLAVSSSDAPIREIGRRVHRMLRVGAFDSLEGLADSLRTSDARLPDGRSMLRYFYDEGMGAVDNPAEWPRHIAELRQWTQAQPGTSTAWIALAYALHDYAWDARGEGFAFTVTDSAHQLMVSRLAAAETALMAARGLQPVCPGWWQAALQIGHLAGITRSDYERVYTEGVSRFPHYEAYYLYKAGHLLPRWYGTPGEWQTFAASAADRLPAPLGDEMYARMVWFNHRPLLDDDEAGLTDAPLSWPRTKRGLAALHQAYPTTIRWPSILALLAWKARDTLAARTAFKGLGNRVDLAVWKSREAFAQARREVGAEPLVASRGP